ncbi:uncharacterized protein LOC110860817 isoform X2 [Folsomia candida]|uniref:uncharacterized protein LOC110860817 isoform X2 n=1 Tax=Folsomia candida TaxID=158441 RepID=UPI000B904CE2|nr:uncharacterized protein LOC110860817 isoform X2 [Folsomia candida]
MQSINFTLSLFLICVLIVPTSHGHPAVQRYKESNIIGYLSGIFGTRSISCHSLRGYSICTHVTGWWRKCTCGSECDQVDGCVCKKCESDEVEDMTTTFMEGIILDGGDVQVMSDTGIDEDDEDNEDTTGQEIVETIDNSDIGWIHELRNEVQEKVNEVVHDVVHLVEEEAPKVETFLNETLHKVEDKIVHFYNETKPVLHHVETEVVTVIENGEDFVKKESEVVGGAMKSSVTWVKDTFHFLKIVMEVVLIIAVGFVLIKLKRSVQEFMGPNNSPTGKYGNNINDNSAEISSISKVVDYNKNNVNKEEEEFEATRPKENN